MDSVLATNALVTLLEFKTWINTPEDETDEDGRNEYCINAASNYIENYCGRKFITPGTALDEIFSGNGTNQMRAVNLPIGTISELAYRTGTGGTSWTSVKTAWTYTNDTVGGRIYFTDGNLFAEGTDNWKISYTYGYARASVPFDLKMVCVMLAARFKKQFEEGAFGLSSRTIGDTPISFSFDKLPDMIFQILNRYKRMTV